MRAQLEWGEDNTRELHSVEELDLALDELGRQAVAEPFLVELSRNDGASMSLGLGKPMTVLDYVPAHLDPPYFQSYAPGASRESLWFRFRGEASEFPPEAAIPVEAGRRALRHFFLTGELSSEVGWQETWRTERADRRSRQADDFLHDWRRARELLASEADEATWSAVVELAEPRRGA